MATIDGTTIISILNFKIFGGGNSTPPLYETLHNPILYQLFLEYPKAQYWDHSFS